MRIKEGCMTEMIAEARTGMKTEELSVGYGKKVVLSGVELEVREGELLTLIGPNGSGKSTILKTLTGQLRSLEGRVLLMERGEEGGLRERKEMSGSEIAKILAMVMTERPTPELMTCREVVGTGRYPYVGHLGILGKEDWQKVDEAMEAVCATEVAQQSFYEISDGQRQRVMLARALCQEPSVLVLDEPTSYLDMKYKLEILENTRRLARERRIAVIMSLHELDLAMKISDRIACVDGERLARVGTPEKIFAGGYVQRLYGVEEENFNPLTGAMYLRAKKEVPKIFVIGGGGSGIPVYYRLQREAVPFAAGILFENDVEMDAARACASERIVAKAFTSITQEQIEEGKRMIDRCEKVLCPLTTFGPLNEGNRQLAEYAKKSGKL